MRSLKNLLALENLLSASLIGFGAVATYVALEFSTYLGFNFGGVIFSLLLIGVFLLVFVPASLLPSWSWARKVSDRQSFLLLLAASAAVRVWFALNSSIFPDEFTFLRILKTHPLENLPNFLANYQLYAGVEDLHPPLATILMSVGYQLYPSILSARMVSVAFSVGAVYLAYIIATELNFKRGALLVAAIFAFLPLDVLFTVTALTDVYALFFGLGAVCTFLRAMRTNRLRWFVLSGVLLGAALWSKYAFPFFWLILIVLIPLIVQFARPLKITQPRALGVALIGLGVFSLWGLINPAVFSIYFVSLASYVPAALSQFVSPPAVSHTTSSTSIVSSLSTSIVSSLSTSIVSSLSTSIVSSLSTSIVSSLSTVSSGTTSSSTIAAAAAPATGILALLYSIFPRFSFAPANETFADLLIQLPLWLSPVVVALCLIGILSLFRNPSRLKLLLLFWLSLPLLAEDLFLRDVRYLLVGTFGVVGLVVTLMEKNARYTRRLAAITLAFVLVFLVFTAPIAQQQYYGITQASTEVQQLGLANSRILTNAPEMGLFLPNATLFIIPFNFNQSSLTQIIKSQGINAVVIINNARANWPVLDNSTINRLFANYTGRFTSMPSQFSWFQIAYSTDTDQH